MFSIVANTGLLRDVVWITTGEPVQCRSIHFFECLVGVMCQRFHSFHQIPFCLTHYIMQARIFNKEKTDHSDTSRIKMIGLIWCDRRDLNSYGSTTRPSNVRVCQFRHGRVLRCLQAISQTAIAIILFYLLLVNT